MAAEDMSLEEMLAATEGYVLRKVLDPPVVTPMLPHGALNHLILPMTALHPGENPLVLCVDLIDWSEAFGEGSLKAKYTEAIKSKDMQLLPAPFGFKGTVPAETLVQICEGQLTDGSRVIVEHCILPNKMKVVMIKNLFYGVPHRVICTNPKNGMKVFQYMFENIGCM